MFVLIFAVCLTLCQISLLPDAQSIPPWPMLALSAIVLLFLLFSPGRIPRMLTSDAHPSSEHSERPGRAASITSDQGEQAAQLPTRAGSERSKRPGRATARGRDLGGQAVLLLFLLINFWQYALLLSEADRQAEHLPSERLSEELYVYGRSSRDGILNYKGMPVNYVTTERVEDLRGAQFSLNAEIILYGMEHRHFKGQQLKLFLPRGMDKTDRPTFLKQGLEYRALAEGVGQEQVPEFSRAALRKKLDDHLESLTPSAKAFVQSIILGYRSEMGAGLQDLFRDAGVVHILVLSGMHLGIIYLVLRTIMPGFIPLPLREVLALGTMAAYLWFINPGASAWRAAIMVLLWSLSKWSGWKTSPDRMLSLVWTMLIIMKPRFIFDVGMYLSFAAIWGLVYLMPIFHFLAARVRYLLPIPTGQYLLKLFTSSVSAQTAVAPITLILFGSIAPQGLLALPFLLPLFYISLIISALLIPLLFFAPTLVTLFNTILDSILNMMSAILFPFARFGWTLEGWPLSAKIALCLLPLIVAGTCRLGDSLLSSGHVQLRFSARNSKPAQIS